MIINLTLTCGVPGLHRNLDDTEAVQVLRDVAALKVDTDDEELASEFLSHFIAINGVDTNTGPEKGSINSSRHRKLISIIAR